MRTRPQLLAATAALGLAVASPLAQTEIPVPPIATRLGTLPGVDALPARPALPDVLVMNDGRPVTSAKQWPARRQEMRRILSYYAVGLAPPAPGNVKGRQIQSERVLDGTVS